MHGQRHSQPTPDFIGSRVCACLGITYHLHFWQNDLGLLRATAATRGWNGYRIRVSAQSSLWRRKFSRRSYRDSYSQASEHDRVRRSYQQASPYPHQNYKSEPLIALERQRERERESEGKILLKQLIKKEKKDKT